VSLLLLFADQPADERFSAVPGRPNESRVLSLMHSPRVNFWNRLND
jgi:hypothetical protein